MNDKIEKLDVARGIAILLVFGYHSLLAIYPNFNILEYDSFFISANNNPNYILLNLTPFGLGNLGVQLFLVISGFLIHLGYLKAGSKLNIYKFYNKRFWRIYPPYFLALIFFSLTTSNYSSQDLISHLGLFHNLKHETFFKINPSFWSLALEMQLYFIYPLYLFLHNKYGLTRSVLIVAIISVFSLGIGIVQGRGVPFFHSIFTQWVVWILGAYFAERFYHNQRVFNGRPIVYVLLLMVLVLLRLTNVFDLLAKLLFSFYFVLVLDWYLHKNIKWNKLFGGIKIIGICSYSLYLFHQPFLPEVIFFFNQSNSDNIIVLTFSIVCAFFFFLFISYISYKVIELNSVKLGSRLYNYVTKRSKRVSKSEKLPI